MTAPIPIGDYTFVWFAKFETPCVICGEEVGYLPCPALALRDKGAICPECVDNQPAFLRHIENGLDEIMSAARECPSEVALSTLKAWVGLIVEQIFNAQIKLAEAKK